MLNSHSTTSQQGTKRHPTERTENRTGTTEDHESPQRPPEEHQIDSNRVTRVPTKSQRDVGDSSQVCQLPMWENHTNSQARGAQEGPHRRPPGSSRTPTSLPKDIQDHQQPADSGERPTETQTHNVYIHIRIDTKISMHIYIYMYTYQYIYVYIQIYGNETSALLGKHMLNNTHPWRR